MQLPPNNPPRVLSVASLVAEAPAAAAVPADTSAAAPPAAASSSSQAATDAAEQVRDETSTKPLSESRALRAALPAAAVC